MKTPKSIFSLLLILLLPLLVVQGHKGVADDAENYRCGEQGGGRRCAEGFCCSRWGWCGESDAYCGVGNCQSQCPGLEYIIPKELFEEFLKHRNDPGCNGRGFYTYEAFLEAAKDYPEFGSTGNETTRKREVAAFLAHTSAQTAGRTAANVLFGFCRKVHGDTNNARCRSSEEFPCVPGKKYYGRGPVQVTWNDNYGRFGNGLGLDLLSNPDLVETDPVISFKTAFWIWMTARSIRPSPHDVIIGNWEPSETDIEAGRLPGLGTTINIIAPTQCGRPAPEWWNEAIIGFYKRYCDIYGIEYGYNLDCYNQRPFNRGSSLAII